MTEGDRENRGVLDDELAALAVLHQEQARARERILERIGGLARRFQSVDSGGRASDQRTQSRQTKPSRTA